MKPIVFFQILDEFYKSKKYRFYILLFMSTIAGIFEYLGLILIFQFILFLSNPTSKHCIKIIDFFKTNFNIDSSYKVILILGVSIAFIYILKNIYMLIFTKISNNILQDLSLNITFNTVKNMLYQDYLTINEISNENKIAFLSKNDFIVWQYCYKFINLFANLTIAFILIMYLFIKFTLCACAAFAFISVLFLIEYKILKKNSNIQNKYFSKSFNTLNDTTLKIINSIKEIKLCANQEYFMEKLKKHAKNYTDLHKERNFYDVFHIYFTEISIMLTFALILTILFYTLNFDNQLLITSISTICIIILRLTPIINRSQSCLYAINSYQNLAIELLEFNNKFDKNITFKTTKEILPFNKTLELKNINFSYKNNINGLKNINLKINKGEFIGIVGKSGCYKTTLSLIIAGLFMPNSGEILIDNQILNKKDYPKWQNNISILSQDYSILINDLNEVNLDILEKLDLNNNSTKIKEKSYGEKQRIALANLLSKDKNILILDEISSSSDVITEDKINAILKDLKGEKTIISIAHRLQILKHCDKIIYMDNGKIIDFDTFSALSKKYEDFDKIVKLSNFKID